MVWFYRIIGKPCKFGARLLKCKVYSQICDDVGATRKYVVYVGNDEFPVGDDVMVMSLAGILEKLRMDS